MAPRDFSGSYRSPSYRYEADDHTHPINFVQPIDGRYFSPPFVVVSNGGSRLPSLGNDFSGGSPPNSRRVSNETTIRRPSRSSAGTAVRHPSKSTHSRNFTPAEHIVPSAALRRTPQHTSYRPVSRVVSRSTMGEHASLDANTVPIGPSARKLLDQIESAISKFEDLAAAFQDSTRGCREHIKDDKTMDSLWRSWAATHGSNQMFEGFGAGLGSTVEEMAGVHRKTRYGDRFARARIASVVDVIRKTLGGLSRVDPDARKHWSSFQKLISELRMARAVTDLHSELMVQMIGSQEKAVHFDHLDGRQVQDEGDELDGE